MPFEIASLSVGTRNPKKLGCIGCSVCTDAWSQGHFRFKKTKTMVHWLRLPFAFGSVAELRDSAFKILVGQVQEEGTSRPGA